MTLLENISRIESAVAAIKTSIENKGQNIPDDAVIEDLANYIDAISGGGINISDTTATADDVISGKDFYLADGTKTSGNIPVNANGIDGGEYGVANGKLWTYMPRGVYPKYNGTEQSWINTKVPLKSSSDLTASGATVSVPAGYYSAAASKAIGNGSVTVKDISINSSGVITAGATVSAGYVSSSPSDKTKQLTNVTGGARFATTSIQTIVSSGGAFYTNSAIQIGALKVSGVAAAGIVKGNTVVINNGKDNLYNVGGSYRRSYSYDYAYNTTSSSNEWVTGSLNVGFTPSKVIIAFYNVGASTETIGFSSGYAALWDGTDILILGQTTSSASAGNTNLKITISGTTINFKLYKYQKKRLRAKILAIE